MKRLFTFILLGIIISLLSISFASAELCKWSDGYYRSCSSFDGSSQKYSYKFSTSNPLSKSSMYNMDKSYGYDRPDAYIYSKDKRIDYNYHNTYNLRKDHRKTVGSYYAIDYSLDYNNEYNQEYYGYDNFKYYDNGYDHEYKYGYNTYKKGYVKYSYEEKSGYEETHKY